MTQNNQVTLRIGANAGAAISAFAAVGVAAGNMVVSVMRTVKRIAMALPNAVQEALNTADTMVKRSQVAGMSTEEFSALMHVAKLSGVQMGELEMAARQTARMHNAELLPSLLATAKEMEGMTDEAAKLAMAQHRFGRSGTALLPILNQGTKAIREQLLEARELGVEIGTKFGRNAEFFNDTLERIKTAFHGMFITLAQRLLPQLQSFATLMLDIAKSMAFKTFLNDTADLMERIANLADKMGALPFLRALSLAESPYGPITSRQQERFSSRIGSRVDTMPVPEITFKPQAGSKIKIEVPEEQAQSAFTTRGFLSAGEASLANRQLAWQNVVAGLLGSIDKNIDRYLPKLEEQEI